MEQTPSAGRSPASFWINKGALPLHIHQRDQHAGLVGQLGKPEAYYFPTQVNNYEVPYTFFGLKPGTTKNQLRDCLKNFTKGDNRITDLSTAYRLKPGTGWDVPAGTLHAPGSLCTYEPQRASDVFSMFQSLTGDAIISEGDVWKNTPPERIGDFDFLVDLVNWDFSLDPQFAEHRFMQPRPARPVAEMSGEGYRENWICYRSPRVQRQKIYPLPWEERGD